MEFLRSVNLNEDSVHLNGRTVVIGGGNVAIDVARTALRTGSELVSMYCLESEAEMPAARDEVEEAKEEDIQIQCGWGPKEILTENGAVTGIVLKKCISVFDENHRFAPVYNENDCITLECENVLLSIGQTILWGNLLKDTAVELRPNQTAQADPVTYQTAEPDIFVGGDVFTGPKFAIDAIAAGKQGCVSIHRFVHKGHSLTLGRDLRQFVELDKNNLDIEEFDTAKRQIPGKKSGIAKETFRDLRSSLTEEQVKIEAGRCLGCGASVVDENKCIGCGLCTTKCEFDAIHLSRDLPEASRMRTAEDKLKGILPYAAKHIMHELGMIVHITKTLQNVAKENNLSEIGSVTLEIGEVSTIVPDYLTDCWKYYRKKFPLIEHSELKIEILPATTYCEDCRQTYPTVEFGRQCPYCKSPNTYLVCGDECNIKEIEAQ